MYRVEYNFSYWSTRYDEKREQREQKKSQSSPYPLSFDITVT